jgi:hypothetical protein
MLNDLRQAQFALARHLRDPLNAPLPEGVNPAEANACLQAMADHVCDILVPAFPVTRAALGDDLWRLTVRLFLKDACCHMPWTTAVQRSFVDHLCASAEMHQWPAWLKEVAHVEWLQTTRSAATQD